MIVISFITWLLDLVSLESGAKQLQLYNIYTAYIQSENFRRRNKSVFTNHSIPFFIISALVSFLENNFGKQRSSAAAAVQQQQHSSSAAAAVQQQQYSSSTAAVQQQQCSSRSAAAAEQQQQCSSSSAAVQQQ